MRSDMQRNEVHVCTAPNGHHLSTDCWCEPTHINWVRNKHGVMILVVEHCDTTLAHRTMVVAERANNRTLPYSEPYATVPLNRSPDAPWITRVLDDIHFGLPPADPNERKID